MSRTCKKPIKYLCVWNNIHSCREEACCHYCSQKGCKYKCKDDIKTCPYLIKKEIEFEEAIEE